MFNAFLQYLQWTAFIVVGYALIGGGDKVVLVVLMTIATIVAIAGLYRERNVNENT
jgi:hypothetical protein